MQNQERSLLDEHFHRKNKVKMLMDSLDNKQLLEHELEYLRLTGQDCTQIQLLINISEESIQILKQTLNQK